MGTNTCSFRARLLQKCEHDNRTAALNIVYVKKKKIYSIFQNITEIVKNKLIFLIIPNGKG